MESIKYGKYKSKRQRAGQGAVGSVVLTMVLCLVTLAALTGCLVLLIENYRLRNEAVAVMANGVISGGMDGVNGGGSSGTVSGNADMAGLQAGNVSVVGGAEGPGSVTIESEPRFSETEVAEISEALAAQAADEAADEVLQSLKRQLQEGEDLSAILRNLYPKEVVVAADGNYHFFPITERLKPHSYNRDGFITDENGILTYQDDGGQVLSQKGIDVSRYQNEINWERVAADGVDFAMVRLGIRGSAEGTLVLDTMYEANVAGALANGIDTGVYFYTQALNEAEAVEEAEFVLEHLAGYAINYPVALDIEAIETSNPRTRNMTKAEWTKVAIAFCERIKADGYEPIIYGNLQSFMLMMDMEQLEQYEKWFAYFRTPIYFPYEHAIWQYSNRGTVDGVDGEVDLNIVMKDLRQTEQE